MVEGNKGNKKKLHGSNNMILKRRRKGMPQDEKKRLGKVHKKCLVEGYKVDQLRVCASFEVDFSPDRRQQQQ
jgi:hypothetical protein